MYLSLYLNWNKCVTRNESLPFLSDCRKGNIFSIWTGTQWIGSNCLWTLDTLKFDGSIRVQFGQLCEARYWGVLTSPGIPLISMVSGIQCVIWLAICFTVSLRQLKVDNCKNSSTPQTFTCIVFFHVSTKYLCQLTSHLTAASDILITRGSEYQCLSLALSADKANVSSSRENITPLPWTRPSPTTGSAEHCSKYPN